MTHIIVWTVGNKPTPFYLEVDGEDKLAEAVDKITKGGQGATIKLYSVIPINYNFTYIDKEEITIKKIPNIEILS